MPARDLTRWKQNEDGSWRRYSQLAEAEAEPEPDPDPEPEAEDGFYTNMTKDELQAQLEARNLPTSGNKPDLIERLEAADAA